MTCFHSRSPTYQRFNSFPKYHYLLSNKHWQHESVGGHESNHNSAQNYALNVFSDVMSIIPQWSWLKLWKKASKSKRKTLNDEEMWIMRERAKGRHVELWPAVFSVLRFHCNVFSYSSFFVYLSCHSMSLLSLEICVSSNFSWKYPFGISLAMSSSLPAQESSPTQGPMSAEPALY